MSAWPDSVWPGCSPWFTHLLGELRVCLGGIEPLVADVCLYCGTRTLVKQAPGSDELIDDGIRILNALYEELAPMSAAAQSPYRLYFGRDVEWSGAYADLSDDWRLGVVANDRRMAVILLRLLRIVRDNQPEQLFHAFDGGGIPGWTPDARVLCLADIINALADDRNWVLDVMDLGGCSMPAGLHLHEVDLWTLGSLQSYLLDWVFVVVDDTHQSIHDDDSSDRDEEED